MLLKNDQGHRDIIHRNNIIKLLILCLSYNRDILTPSTKYTPVKIPSQKNTSVNMKDYGAKLYQVNMTIVSSEDVQPKLLK